MKQYSLTILIAVFVLYLSPPKGKAQGCGDAGACSINALKPGEENNVALRNSLKTGFALGHAQYGVFILASYTEYQRQIDKRLNGSLKVTGSLLYGRLATNVGLSDLYASMSYELVSKLRLIAAIKFPFNKSDKKKNGLPLPMSYQTSLGTTDVILGISYARKTFLAGVAFQQPLRQNNNHFRLSDYPAGSIDTNYLTTNEYHRQSDILLRFSYVHHFNANQSSLTGGLLPIYHLGNDTYLDASGERKEIAHSAGLTFNLNLFYRYPLKDRQSIELSLGIPVISRKARPDGLSSISTGLQYKVLF